MICILPIWVIPNIRALMQLRPVSLGPTLYHLAFLYMGTRLEIHS